MPRASTPSTMPRTSPSSLLASILLGTILGGCGVTVQLGRPTETARRGLEVRERSVERCVHGALGSESPYREVVDAPSRDPEVDRFLARFPTEVHRAATAAGIESLLSR